MRIFASVLTAFLGLLPLMAGSGGAPEIFPQTGHVGWVSTATLSPDGKRLLSGGWSGLIKLWDVRSGREVRTLKGDSTNIMCLEFTPDGLRAASLGTDNTIIYWDLATGEALRTWDVGSGLGGSLAFLANGRQILFSRMREVRLLDVATGKDLAAPVNNQADPSRDDLEFSPDGRFVVTQPMFKAGSPREVQRLWDFRNHRVIRDLPNGLGFPAAFTPDGARILSHLGMDDLTLQDTLTGRVLWSVPLLKKSPDQLMICEDGSRAVTAADGFARVWNVANGAELQALSIPRGMKLLALSRDGRKALFKDQDFVNPTYQIYETQRGQLLETLNETKKESWDTVAFSADGQFLVLAGGAGLVRKDLHTGLPDQRFQGDGMSVSSLACAPDRNLAAVAEELTIAVWDLARGTCLRSFRMGTAAVSMGFAPGGKLLATGHLDGTLSLWDTGTGREQAHVAAHRGTLLGMAFSPDGSLLATAGNDGLVRLWDGRTGAPVRNLEGHLLQKAGVNDTFTGVDAVAFSPDGARIASAGVDGTLRIWDAATGKALETLRGHDQEVMAVAFAGKGRFLVSGGRDHTVRLWEPGSGKPARVLHTFPGMVTSVVCAPDGSRVAARSGDGVVKFWDAETWQEALEVQGARTRLQQSNALTPIAFSSDARHLLSFDVGSVAASLWDLGTGKQVAQLLQFKDDSWIALLPEGYFQASPGGARHLNVRMGIEVGSVDQFFGKFYRPELVQLALEGRALPGGENLTDIASRRPAPEVTIPSPLPGTTVDADHVPVTVKVMDAGGGIGGVQVFLNGTQVANEGRGLAVKEGARKGERILVFTVPLASGVNELSAVASNGDNSMESVPARVTVRSRAAVVRPDFHALVVGIDTYRNQSISLKHAGSDAVAFGEALRKAASPLFNQTRIQVLSTPEATTREAILKAFETLAGQVRPNDVFVFYDASHGVVDVVGTEEQYFLLTSNVLLLSSSRLAESALSQKDLARCIGAIPAQKKIVFLDTCDAGKGGREIQIALLQQTRGLTEATAIKVLQRSIGSAVFSASSDAQAALEGYRGHGLFTYFLIEGLGGKADVNREGFVTVRGLADYVEEQVVTVSEQVFKRQQTPTIQTSGNFPIGKVSP